MIVECRPPWRKGLGPEWNPGCGGGEGTAGFWGAASWTMPLEPVSSPWMTGALECSVDAVRAHDRDSGVAMPSSSLPVSGRCDAW